MPAILEKSRRTIKSVGVRIEDQKGRRGRVMNLSVHEIPLGRRANRSRSNAYITFAQVDFSKKHEETDEEIVIVLGMLHGYEDNDQFQRQLEASFQGSLSQVPESEARPVSEAVWRVLDKRNPQPSIEAEPETDGSLLPALKQLSNILAQIEEDPISLAL